MPFHTQTCLLTPRLPLVLAVQAKKFVALDGASEQHGDLKVRPVATTSLVQRRCLRPSPLPTVGCAPQHEVRAPTSSVEPARTPCSHRCAIPGSPMLRAASRSPSAPRSRPATTTATPRRASRSRSSRCPTRSRRWRRPSRRMTSRWRTSSRTSSCVGRLFQTSRFDGPLPLLTRAPAPSFAAGLHRRVRMLSTPSIFAIRIAYPLPPPQNQSNLSEKGVRTQASNAAAPLPH